MDRPRTSPSDMRTNFYFSYHHTHTFDDSTSRRRLTSTKGEATKKARFCRRSAGSTATTRRHELQAAAAASEPLFAHEALYHSSSSPTRTSCPSGAPQPALPVNISSRCEHQACNAASIFSSRTHRGRRRSPLAPANPRGANIIHHPSLLHTNRIPGTSLDNLLLSDTRSKKTSLNSEFIPKFLPPIFVEFHELP